MNSMFPALALLAAISLAACGNDGPAQEAPLAGARIGGPFTLIGEDGKPVRDGDFAGKYRIVYFGYTFCPDVCPTDMAKLGQAMRSLDKEAPETSQKIVPLFISVDPERDTPAVLKAYTDNFYPRLIGLTGTPQQIADVARSYAVAFSKQKSGASYLVGHTEVAYLMGPRGDPITSLPLEQGPAAIAAELKRWVR